MVIHFIFMLISARRAMLTNLYALQCSRIIFANISTGLYLHTYTL